MGVGLDRFTDLYLFYNQSCTYTSQCRIGIQQPLSKLHPAPEKH